MCTTRPFWSRLKHTIQYKPKRTVAVRFWWAWRTDIWTLGAHGEGSFCSCLGYTASARCRTVLGPRLSAGHPTPVELSHMSCITYKTPLDWRRFESTSDWILPILPLTSIPPIPGRNPTKRSLSLFTVGKVSAGEPVQTFSRFGSLFNTSTTNVI